MGPIIFHIIPVLHLGIFDNPCHFMGVSTASYPPQSRSRNKRAFLGLTERIPVYHVVHGFHWKAKSRIRTPIKWYLNSRRQVELLTRPEIDGQINISHLYRGYVITFICKPTRYKSTILLTFLRLHLHSFSHFFVRCLWVSGDHPTSSCGRVDSQSTFGSSG